MNEEEEKINVLMGVTGVSRAEAESLLSQNGWDVNLATNEHFQPRKAVKSNEKPKPSSSSSKPAPSSSRVATLQNTSHESEDEEDEEEGQEYFAGGKASGVAIKGPTKTQEVVGGILKKAEETGKKELEEKRHEEKKQKTSFKGKAYKLGASEIDKSEEVEMEDEEEGEEQDAQISLTFWQDGFSIDDGPLRPYDDPANSQFLMEIKSNKIPQEIAQKYGHNLRILVSRRLEDKFVPPKKVLKPFSGSGNRLGSFVPGEATTTSPPPATTTTVATPAVAEPSSSTSSDDKNKTSIQIRLADGTRLVLKISPDETVAEIRRFILLSRSSESSRNFVLMTTFPNKEITDETQTIKQASLQNSVVVQKYK